MHICASVFKGFAGTFPHIFNLSPQLIPFYTCQIRNRECYGFGTQSSAVKNG